MGAMSFWHWALVILVIVLLFGRGKISDLMGDVAKGIKIFMKRRPGGTAQTAGGDTQSLEQKAAVKAEAEKAKS